jgi:ATP-binding cassette subfamily B protein RaxB
MNADIQADIRPGRRRLPVIQQNELGECGLACLAMIARYYGHDVDLASLRRRFPASLRGATLSRLISIAGNLGLDTRPLRAELEHLSDLRVPCILHWNLNHFVVLRSIAGGKVTIHDPAHGHIVMSLKELSRHFTGVVLELNPAATFTPIHAKQRISLRRLIGQVHGVRRAVIQVSLLALALEALTLALPLAMQWVLDLVLVSSDLSLLTLIGIGFLAVVVFQSLIAMLRGWVVAELGASLSAQWVTNLFGHLLRLPLDYFEKRSVGGVLSRFISVHSIQQTMTGSFIEAILDGLTVVFVVLLLLVYSGPLTLLVLAAFGLYTLLRWVTYRRMRRLKEEQLIQSGRQQSLMIESIKGAQAIKLANTHDERRARMANAAIEVANREAAINRVNATFSALSRLIFGGQRILLIWIGAVLTLRGELTAGMLVVFVTYADLFASRGGGLIDKMVEFRLLGMHGERIADIALEPPEPHVHSEYTGPAPEPSIEVENLSFRYSDDDPWVIHDCSFRIQAGESVAVVGPSGCGKTTLAKILLGLLRPGSGTIRVGGIDIERIGLAAHRNLCAAVMQEDVLFAGSMADNIAFFDADASMKRIETAARAAQIHDDIVAMPMGYESLVGDMGSTLSGGQKQRVLLARALYRHPAILLLDEATSHLDVARERMVNQSIADLAITRIVIAHRPETIRSADRVIVMDGGRIVQPAQRFETAPV